MLRGRETSNEEKKKKGNIYRYSFSFFFSETRVHRFSATFTEWVRHCYWVWTANCFFSAYTLRHASRISFHDTAYFRLEILSTRAKVNLQREKQLLVSVLLPRHPSRIWHQIVNVEVKYEMRRDGKRGTEEEARPSFAQQESKSEVEWIGCRFFFLVEIVWLVTIYIEKMWLKDIYM